jgi:hypothetical protein
MLPAMNRENFRLLLLVMAFFTLLMVLLADRPSLLLKYPFVQNLLRNRPLNPAPALLINAYLQLSESLRDLAGGGTSERRLDVSMRRYGWIGARLPSFPSVRAGLVCRFNTKNGFNGSFGCCQHTQMGGIDRGRPNLRIAR